MSKSLEVFKIEEKIKVSFLKNGGNILEVMKELNLPQEYIKKVVEKIRKKETRNVSLLVSDTIASYILMGHESRKLQYYQALKELETSGKAMVSVCCEAPVLTDSSMGVVANSCSMCKLICEVKPVTHNDIYRIKKEILEQLREEDRMLMEFAEKMGYTNVPKEPTLRVNQNIVVIGDDKDKQVVQEIEKLSPQDRDKLLDRLNTEIRESDDEETKQSTQNQNV